MAAVEKAIYTQMAQDFQRDYENGILTEQEYYDALDAIAQAMTGME